MQSRLIGLFVAATFLTVASQPAWAQPVDIQKINNLKSQQTSIENRIADLQSQVDDASADKTYCSAQERTEDFNRLRALQREIAALRNEYADFKAGFIKLASTQTAGPQFDAAGIHPDERSYWTADDNALQKLRASALAKAARVEQALIRDCNDKKAPPPSAPVTETPVSKSPSGGQTGPGKAPVTPPSKGPTAALGGPPLGSGCTEKERTERRLRIQEELLRLQEELIPIDGTKPEGRARQLQLIREIDRLNALMNSDCPPLLPPITAKAGSYTPAPPKVPSPKVGNQVTPSEPKPQPAGADEFTIDPLARLVLQAAFLLDDLDDAAYYCDWKDIEELSAKLADLAKGAREIAKSAAAKGDKARADAAERIASQLEAAALGGMLIQACRNFRLILPENKGALPPTEKPTPPKISIVEDVRQPPNPSEVRAIEARVRELGNITRSYPQLLEGCHPDIWDKHIAHLEGLAKRARQIAEDVKRGYSNGVSAKDAEQVANDAQKAVDNAKRGKAANLEQWRAPECPQYTPLPEQPKAKQTSALPYNLTPFAARVLTLHNAERAAVGAQPLRWNPALEASATAYATQLARVRDIVHAPREGRGIERENLLKALPSWSPERMMQVWTSEKRDFVAGYFPNVARDGNWMNVAHYTQMIWPTTTDIGCGMAPGGGFNWLVCRYSPGGNKDNKPVGYGNEPRHPERG